MRYCFAMVFYLCTLILMIVGLPSLLLGRRGVMFMARLWARIALFWLHKLCGLRVEFRGLQHRLQGGYIVASKHQSALETFALVTQLPRCTIVLKRQLLYLPLFGLYLIVSGQIAIERAHIRKALLQLLSQAGRALREGRQVVIYPEGTRQSVGAEPNYKQGVAMLYEKTGVPCVPVAVNTGMFWPRRGLLCKPGVAIIEFLPPIPAGLPRDVFFARLTDALEIHSRRLVQEGLDARESVF